MMLVHGFGCSATPDETRTKLFRSLESLGLVPFHGLDLLGSVFFDGTEVAITAPTTDVAAAHAFVASHLER